MGILLGNKRQCEVEEGVAEHRGGLPGPQQDEPTVAEQPAAVVSNE